MTGEKPGAEEALYWDADGPLGPEKFENDLPQFDAANSPRAMATRS